MLPNHYDEDTMGTPIVWQLEAGEQTISVDVPKQSVGKFVMLQIQPAQGVKIFLANAYLQGFMKATSTARMEETARMTNASEIKSVITEELQFALLGQKTAEQAVADILTDSTIMTYLRNSLLVSFGSSILATIVCSFAGYSFAKFRYRGRGFVMGLFMMSQAFPQAILLLSIYELMRKTGLLGSYWALLISYVVFTLPVGTWTLKSYFDQIPDSLIESAKIDGAGHFRIMRSIVFPMAVPGMISIAIYGFVWSWNDLLYSMTLVTDPARRTLVPGLVMTFLGEASTNWGYMMAASIVAAIPVTIIFVFLQRYFIQGLTAGAVKG